MAHYDQLGLLMGFKTLADPARLKIVRLLARQEMTVKDLAAALDLTEPTVSHHLSKLRAAGFLTLRMEGSQHFYSLNAESIARFKAQVAELEVSAPAALDEKHKDWLDALDMSDADKKILREYTFAGRLRQIPSKQNKLIVVLHWLATHFEKDRTYSEQEVNAIIQTFHSDYATLRRDLVDFGYLRREKGGQSYWVTPDDEVMPGG